jgi:two-component system LytT family response regulator
VSAGDRGLLRALIVDDEELARAVVREYLGDHQDVEIVGECCNGFEAVKAITELAPDVVFLDVQMPKLSGFEVLELVGGGVNVIFTTAYDEYALQAFAVHAVDYLLKPFDQKRFTDALARARGRADTASGTEPSVLARSARPRGTPLDRILVREGAKVHIIAVETLDFVEADDDWVRLRVGANVFRKQQTLAELESLLDPARFVRTHRSYLLNVERLARIELYAKDSRLAILRDGTKLPLSRAGFARLRRLL